MSIQQIEQGIIHYKKEAFHFVKTGHGPQLAILFHGMDGDPSDFFVIQEHLLDKNNFNAEKFSLWGHSLGARICLKVAELQPNWISEMILISPDGIAKNAWYKMATSSRLGRLGFKKFTQNPDMFVKLVSKMRLSSENKINFVKRVTKNSNKLEKTYLTWTSLHYLVPFLAVIKINIRKQNIVTHIFTGKQDPIIPFKSIDSFARKQGMIHLHLLEGGHHLISKKYLDIFLSVLK